MEIEEEVKMDAVRTELIYLKRKVRDLETILEALLNRDDILKLLAKWQKGRIGLNK